LRPHRPGLSRCLGGATEGDDVFPEGRMRSASKGFLDITHSQRQIFFVCVSRVKEGTSGFYRRLLIEMKER